MSTLRRKTMLKNTKGIYGVNDVVNIRVKVFSVFHERKVTHSLRGVVVKIIPKLIKTNLSRYTKFPEKYAVILPKPRLVIKLKHTRRGDIKPYVIVTLDKMKPENTVRVFRC